MDRGIMYALAVSAAMIFMTVAYVSVLDRAVAHYDYLQGILTEMETNTCDYPKRIKDCP
jgi:hypothetical protein